MFAGHATYTFNFTNPHMKVTRSEVELRPICSVHRARFAQSALATKLARPHPCDFFMWGYVKSKVYVTRPANFLELKGRTRAAFAEITVEMRKKAALAYRERLEKVIEKDGVTSRCTTELKVNGFV